MRKYLFNHVAGGILPAAMRTNLSLLLAVLGLMACITPARAGTATYDLNTQPTTEFVLTGAAEWLATGGVTNSGHIKLTDNTGQTCAVLFPDFDGGLVVKSFTFECMIKCGDWYANPPADGFSVNYARGDDPIIPLIESGTDPGRGSTTDGWAGSQDNGGTEIDLPEEGTQTGIAIGFDTWGTGTAPVGGSNGANDVRGISVRVDGVQKAQVAMPGVVFADGDSHPFATDALTLITGPFSNGPDPANANQGNPDNGDGTTAPPALGKRLNWVPLKVTVDETGILNVFWKGSNIVQNLQTTYGPGPGRIIFGASTGGAMEYAGIDDIKITTVPSDTALVGTVSSLPGANGIKITANDSGQSVVDLTKPMSITLDGNTVTPTSSTKTQAVTTLIYQLPGGQLFPSGSSHTVDVSLQDTRGVAITATNRSFTAPTYITVPTAYAVTGVDTTKAGFKARPYQTTAAQPNTLVWTEEQLSGFHGPNKADLTQTVNGQPIDANGFYTVTDPINWDGVSISRTDGNFNNNNGFTEFEFPGMPPVPAAGNGGDYNNLAEEVLTYVNFPTAGLYTMGVNSDDGFRVATGSNPRDQFSALNLGEFNGGRGASDTLFNIVIQQPGYYPMRMIWENGGGGANCEWFTVNANGSKVLINDPTDPTALKAYYAGPGLPAAVTSVYPGNNTTGIRPDTSVIAKLTDGSTQVANASLSLNGGAPVTGTKSGAVTTATIPGGSLPPGSTNTATLVWTDNGTPAVTRTNTWSFVILTYLTLPTDLATPVGSGNAANPGFTVQVVQTSDTVRSSENNNDSTESMLAGLYAPDFPNLATLTGAVSNNFFVVTGVINWDRGANDGGNGEDGNFRAGNGFPEQPLPGIPGSTGGFNSLAEGVQTYVEFPTAGFYQMGVNSDDNFRVTVEEGPPGPILTVSGAASGSFGVVSMSLRPAEVVGGRAVYGVPPPATPIVAPIVYLTPGGINDPGPYPDVTGKIALLDRSGSNLGTTSTGGKCKAAQDRGAVAVIFTTPGDTGTPFYAGGTRTDINIPCLTIADVQAARLKTALASGAVTGTIQGDSRFTVGGFDDGRGATDTIMSFIVPQAGVYPMRMIFHQGGGGANCEWFSVKADGTKVLVNDVAGGGLKAYRTRTAVVGPRFNTPTRSGSDIVITWTGSGTLQQATALTGTAGDWSDVTPPPSGNTYTVTAATSGNRFFRLR
jgi:hypothetical protein